MKQPTSHLESVLHSLAEPHNGAGVAGPGLADRALARAAQRRRRTGAIAVATAAVAAVLVVLTVVLVPRSAPRATPPADRGVRSVFAQPRQNVLFIGSDAGPGRTGTRPDTVIVASIDTRTGATVLFGLPRNLERVPFAAGTGGQRAWPNGFFCPQDACLLNAVWQWGENNGNQYYPGDDNPGLTATTDAVEGITGLTIDQTATVNLKGMVELVDAVGGVTLTVTERLPMGGNGDPSSPQYHRAFDWIDQGANQRFDGFHALWYARSRWSSDDFHRMYRQQCLVSALIRQVSPSRLLTYYPALTKVIGDNVRLSIPAADLPDWAELMGKIKQGGVTMVGLIPPDRTEPDFDAIQSEVTRQIAKSANPGTTPPSTQTAPAPSMGTTDSGLEPLWTGKPAC